MLVYIAYNYNGCKDGRSVWLGVDGGQTRSDMSV